MKRIAILLGAILVAACLASFSLGTKKITVVIDAAHGGKDFGATYETVTEKELVAAISAKVKALNDDADIELHFTRLSDEFVDLSERAKIINTIKPDLVLSLHVDANKNAWASGMGIIVAKEHADKAKSRAYADQLSGLFAKNHGIKVKDVSEGPFFILKNSAAPALIVELGYLSNENDRQRLTDEKQQDAMAQTLLEFISELK
jgi:N-acetylmuramoyl-L-alanine amidase